MNLTEIGQKAMCCDNFDKRAEIQAELDSRAAKIIALAEFMRDFSNRAFICAGYSEDMGDLLTRYPSVASIKADAIRELSGTAVAITSNVGCYTLSGWLDYQAEKILEANTTTQKGEG